jgi:anti-sigma B factor antagonist
MAQELQIEVLESGTKVVLSGRLDARSAAVARALLHSVVDQGEGDVLLHVGELEIWDASGLGVLVGAHRKARRAGRRLVLTEVPPRQVRLLRATRLHRLLTVEPAASWTAQDGELSA